MNRELARHNMIVQQIRPWDVNDDRVLEAMAKVPRESFVPENYQNLAFSDLEIPLNDSVVMMFPRIEGRMLQALNIQPNDNVLEVGTGSGYVTAVMSKLGKKVTSVEIDEALAQSAQARLTALGIHNASVAVGDAANGWNSNSPYDAIAISQSLTEIPKTYLEQLKVGGRLFAVIGTEPMMQAVIVKRINANSYETTTLFDTTLPPLQNQKSNEHFEF